MRCRKKVVACHADKDYWGAISSDPSLVSISSPCSLCRILQSLSEVTIISGGKKKWSCENLTLAMESSSLDKSRGIIPGKFGLRKSGEWTDVSFFCQLQVWKISCLGHRRNPSKQISGETSRNYRDHQLNSATLKVKIVFSVKFEVDNIFAWRELMFDLDNLLREIKIENQWLLYLPTLVLDKFSTTFPTGSF